MLEKLKIRIKESEKPVGIKKSSYMDLPPEDYVYGYKPKKDEVGVNTRKHSSILINFHFLF